MQLMTEPKLDHRSHHHHHHHHHHSDNHHHQQLTSITIDQSNQEQLEAPLAGCHSAATNINSNQLIANQTLNSTATPTNYPLTGNQQQHVQRLQLSPPLVNQQQQQTVATNIHLTPPPPPPPPPSATSTPATMNIQPTGYTKNHLINNNGPNVHMSPADELSIKKRREDLSRRPSYRKIFNDLTGLSGPLDPPPPTAISIGQLAPPNRLSPQQQQLNATNAQQPQPPSSSPSPQALDLLNSISGVASSLQQDPATSQSPVSVVDLQTTTPTATQLAQQQLQHSNQQQHHHLQPHHIPTNHLQQQQQQLQHHHHQQQQQQRHHHHHQQPNPHQQQQQQQHQIHQAQTTTSSPINSGIIGGEPEATKKRELRLQKNREAAKECRRKKKEYIKCLENRVAVLENQNKALIDELKTLKDLYCKSTTE